MNEWPPDLFIALGICKWNIKLCEDVWKLVLKKCEENTRYHMAKTTCHCIKSEVLSYPARNEASRDVGGRGTVVLLNTGPSQNILLTICVM
jgi:hypothetical protein